MTDTLLSKYSVTILLCVRAVDTKARTDCVYIRSNGKQHGQVAPAGATCHLEEPKAVIIITHF